MNALVLGLVVYITTIFTARHHNEEHRIYFHGNNSIHKKIWSNYATSDDFSIFDSILNDIKSDQTNGILWGNKIYIIDKTTEYASSKNKQLIPRKYWNVIPNEVLANIIERRKSSIRLKKYKPAIKSVLTTKKNIERIDKEQEAKSPLIKPRVVIEFDAPGYSKNKKIAAVNFTIDDGGIHGKHKAIYVLEKHIKWMVKYKEIFSPG